MKEVEIKLNRVRKLIQDHNLKGMILSKRGNFSWITGGAHSHIETTKEMGCAQILIAEDRQVLVTDNIESKRIIQEELSDVPFEVETRNWYDDKDKIMELHGKGWGIDTDLPGFINITEKLSRVRAPLTEEEVERYKWLGSTTSKILEKVCQEIKVGDEEQEVAARLAQDLLKEGIRLCVNLVAADQRIFRYRHPLPKNHKIEKYVMVVICAEKWGLIANATRFVHFGLLSTDLQQKLDAVQQVEATMILQTRPGIQMNQILNAGINQYALFGFSDEWKLHHQGGPTGYFTRDFLVTPQSNEVVQTNQAFAWNPSITGIKTEDTILVTDEGYEFLTGPIDWPKKKVINDQEILIRPDILIK